MDRGLKFFSFFAGNALKQGATTNTKIEKSLQTLMTQSMLKELTLDTIIFHWNEKGPEQLTTYIKNIEISKFRYALNPEAKCLDEFSSQMENMFIFSSNTIEKVPITKSDTYRILNEWKGLDMGEIKKELIKYTTTPKKREIPPGKLEVLQHYVALRMLKANKDAPLTEAFIKDIHRALMGTLLDDDGQDINAGNYRTALIGIRGKPVIFVHQDYVAERMANLVVRFNQCIGDEKIDTCLLAGWLMAEFIHIHPFNDGNGRVSRLLFNYALMKRGINFVIPFENTKKYISAIDTYGWDLDNKTRLSDVWLYSAMIVAHAWGNFYTAYSKMDIYF